MKLEFNDNWNFNKVGDSNKQVVTLPHDAMIFEKRTAESPGGVHISWFEGHDYEYEKTFNIENKDDGVYIFEFEGVYHDANVFINNQHVLFEPNGYTDFYIEANDYIVNGVNTIKVTAKNSDQPNSRWYSGAGLYRPVYLHILPKSHLLLNGVKIKTTDYVNPTIQLSVLANEVGSVKIEIRDENEVIYTCEDKEKSEFQFVVELPNAKLWSSENPKLYNCTVKFNDDVQSINFGVRKIEWDSTNGFRINGEREILKGACIHHDNGVLGACAYQSAEERKIILLKKAGYNAIRSSHNPCSKYLLDACDKHGMMVLDEYIDMWYIHKNKYDYADYVETNYKQDLKRIIDKDYNHPSVIGYSVGNEVAETAQQRGIELCDNLVKECHRLDDTRPVTCGINIFFNYLSSLGFGVYSDEKAEKSDGRKVGSEFFNTLAGITGAEFMKWGATLSGSDKKTRDAFATMDLAGYNYGIKRYKKDLKKYPNRLILGSETFCSDAYKFWELAKETPMLVGDFVWVGMDYLGEVGLGAWEYKEYAPDFNKGVGWITAGSGRLDITGREFGEMAYTRVAFEIDKLRMAVVPPHTYKEKHSPSAWRMTNTIESWSFNGCNGMSTEVEVYARGAKVELFVNDKKVGSKNIVNDCRFIFKTKYYDGILKAISYDKNGEIIEEITLETAQNETKLTLVPEEKVGDLLYVRLRYTDNEGNIKPLIRGDIQISVKGGKLLGLGNGCAYNNRGYLTDTTDTYYGEALAVIKPENQEVEVVGKCEIGNTSVTVVGY